MTLVDEVRTRPRPPAPGLGGAIRKAAGVSQERMARELGVNRVTVARWEAGTRQPAGATLRAYLTLLDQMQAALR